jgi:hypothetical protein
VTKSVKIGGGVRQGCCLSPFLFNLYSEYVTQEALEDLGVFKVGGQIIERTKGSGLNGSKHYRSSISS